MDPQLFYSALDLTDFLRAVDADPDPHGSAWIRMDLHSFSLLDPDPYPGGQICN